MSADHHELLENEIYDIFSPEQHGYRYACMLMVYKIYQERHQQYHSLKYVWDFYTNIKTYNYYGRPHCMLSALAHDVCYVPNLYESKNSSIRWIKLYIRNMIDIHDLDMLIKTIRKWKPAI